MARIQALIETPLLAVRDIACRSPRSGPGALRGGEGTHLVLVRHGAFTAHVGGRGYVADPCTALVSWAEREYRIGHPGDCGDDCVVIELSPGLADEALAALVVRREVELALGPALQVEVARLARRVRDGGDGDPLAREERTLELVQAVAGVPARRSLPRTARGTTARRRLVRRAVELLHRDLAAPTSIGELAGELGCSPFHLMHAMRAERGTTVRGYRIAARLGAALHRLADGETDLARLALDLGFASHAHLTDTCVRLTGAPPRALRERLGGTRSFPEAPRRPAS